MKLKYTCFLYLLLITIVSFSQTSTNRNRTPIPKKSASASLQTQSRSKDVNNTYNTGSNMLFPSTLTGVWRGFFTSGMGFFQEKYRYEVQIGQLSNNGIKGVTYSYKTTVFYGKAGLAGMYTPSTKNLILKENKLLEVKMSNGDDACLMTCYLEYSKVGDMEILEGTFTSVNIQSKTDCGSGRVYLEKVPESDFYKEPFIKDYEEQKKNPPVKKTPPKVIQKKITTTTPKTSTEKKRPIKKDEVIKNNPSVVTAPPPPPTIDKVVIKPMEEAKKPLPKDLVERENKIAKVIVAEGDEIRIDLFDNGQIDNDTVTVYHNNQVVVSKKRLCHQPITLRIKADPRQPRNEFVMVAENLGNIPPNTALMIITVGKQRFEVFLTSTEQKNAVVVVECRPPSLEGK